MPISAWGLHFPNSLNSSFETAAFGCRRYTILEKTVIMHVLDKGTEEEGAALERAADFAIEKAKFQIPQ